MALVVASPVLWWVDKAHKPRVFDPPRATMVLVAILFVFSFTQTANVNSGGTPGPSRYGLWLLPFVVPVLGGIHSGARWIRVLAVASVVWSAWVFAPGLPENYLSPSSFASHLWRWSPGSDNPLAEVFAERVSGHEPARPPLASAGSRHVQND